MIDRLKLNINLILLRYRLLHFLSLSISRKACVIIIDVVVVVVAFTTLVQCLLNDSKYWISFKIQVLTVDSVMLLKNYACRLNISVRWDRGDWEWERNAQPILRTIYNRSLKANKTDKYCKFVENTNLNIFQIHLNLTLHSMPFSTIQTRPKMFQTLSRLSQNIELICEFGGNNRNNEKCTLREKNRLKRNLHYNWSVLGAEGVKRAGWRSISSHTHIQSMMIPLYWYFIHSHQSYYHWHCAVQLVCLNMLWAHGYALSHSLTHTLMRSI